MREQKRRDIFTVLGILPEPGGYSLAKFSRGYPKQTYQEWAEELTSEGAEKFYNTYYFDYGHTSIADMAHVTVIVQNISTVARMLVIDEPLMDVQEVSTRYVDFSQQAYEIPPEVQSSESEGEFRKACEYLFERYDFYCRMAAALLKKKYLAAKPSDMSDDKAERTFNARAFDEARYCLPCSFHTALGFIVNARTLERIIVRLKSSSLQEMQDIGEDLRKAVQESPAYSPHFPQFRQPSAPTLVKYADTCRYLCEVYDKIYKFAEDELLSELSPPENERSVELFLPQDDEVDAAATLLYKVLPHSYRQILEKVSRWSKQKIDKLISLAYENRQSKDLLIREMATGRLTFDVCIDNGAFRDLHRHRNMIHIFKELSGKHGIDVPREMQADKSLAYQFVNDMSTNLKLADELNAVKRGLGEYVLPMAARRRALFRLDAWQLQYLTELRTTPRGNWSYRDVAYRMYEEYAKKFPLRAKHFRVTNPAHTDFWNR